MVEEPLGKIIKEMHIKDEGIIAVDPNLHPYKKRHLIAHGLAHHIFNRKTGVNYFVEDRERKFNNWLMREQEKEAEIFATYYLIPEEKLGAILKQE